MRCVLIIVKFLELILVDRGDGNDDDARILSLGGRMLDDLLQVFLVQFQGNMLLMARNACIICTEEDGLGRVSILLTFQ